MDIRIYSDPTWTREGGCIDLGPTKGLRTTMSRQAPRYMHSNTSGHCEKFYFQGCGRNSNNFYAKEACRETCEEEGAENEEDAAFFTKIADLIKNNYENKKKPWYERCNGQHPC
jgi:hypothetical protein